MNENIQIEKKRREHTEYMRQWRKIRENQRRQKFLRMREMEKELEIKRLYAEELSVGSRILKGLNARTAAHKPAQ